MAYTLSAFHLDEQTCLFKNAIPQVRGVTVGRKRDHDNKATWRVACSVMVNDKKLYLTETGDDPGKARSRRS